MPAGYFKKYSRPAKVYRRRRNPKTSKKLTSKIKKTIMSIAETKVVGKQLPGGPTTPAQPLFHNKVFYLGKLLATAQGVQDANDYSVNTVRVGDEIQLTNLNIRFLLSSFQPNTWYKLILFWYESTVALTDALVYFTQGAKLLDRYNTEQISIIDQKIVNPGTQNRIPTEASPPGVNFGARRTQLVSLSGNWKGKRIKYLEGGSVPKFKNIGMAIVAYDSVSTLQTTQLAEVVYDYKLRFKDI